MPQTEIQKLTETLAEYEARRAELDTAWNSAAAKGDDDKCDLYEEEQDKLKTATKRAQIRLDTLQAEELARQAADRIKRAKQHSEAGKRYFADANQVLAEARTYAAKLVEFQSDFLRLDEQARHEFNQAKSLGADPVGLNGLLEYTAEFTQLSDVITAGRVMTSASPISTK